MLGNNCIECVLKEAAFSYCNGGWNILFFYKKLFVLYFMQILQILYNGLPYIHDKCLLLIQRCMLEYEIVYWHLSMLGLFTDSSSRLTAEFMGIHTELPNAMLFDSYKSPLPKLVLEGGDHP